MSGNAVSFLCVFGAILLAGTDHDGWGWLIFLAIIFGSCGHD